MNLPKDKVKEVCIDMKPSLKRLAEGLFPSAKVVVDPFHVVADANRRVDEARRIEQEIISRRVRIPMGLLQGCNTKIKMLKHTSFGLRNVDVYRRKIMLKFLPPEYFHRK